MIVRGLDGRSLQNTTNGSVHCLQVRLAHPTAQPSRHFIEQRSGVPSAPSAPRFEGHPFPAAPPPYEVSRLPILTSTHSLVAMQPQCQYSAVGAVQANPMSLQLQPQPSRPVLFNSLSNLQPHAGSPPSLMQRIPSGGGVYYPAAPPTVVSSASGIPQFLYDSSNFVSVTPLPSQPSGNNSNNSFYAVGLQPPSHSDGKLAAPGDLSRTTSNLSVLTASTYGSGVFGSTARSMTPVFGASQTIGSSFAVATPTTSTVMHQGQAPFASSGVAAPAHWPPDAVTSDQFAIPSTHHSPQQFFAHPAGVPQNSSGVTYFFPTQN